VTIYAGQVTLSTTWARYSVSVLIPSIAGKTLGTASNDLLATTLWTSAGTTYNARTGSLGIQSATIDFWGMQVEEGSVATPFEVEEYGANLRRCQRYFQRWVNPPLRGYTSASAQPNRMGMPLSITMRAAPVPSFTSALPVADSLSSSTASLGTQYCSAQKVELDMTGATSLTAGKPCLVFHDGGSAALDLTAEL